MSQLTTPQLRGLEALAVAHHAKRRFVRRSHETHGDPKTPWTFSINSKVARTLEALGLAEGKLVDARERIHEPLGDIDIDIDLLRFCTTKYRLTRKGWTAVKKEQARRAKEAVKAKRETLEFCAAERGC